MPLFCDGINVPPGWNSEYCASTVCVVRFKRAKLSSVCASPVSLTSMPTENCNKVSPPASKYARRNSPL